MRNTAVLSVSPKSWVTVGGKTRQIKANATIRREVTALMVSMEKKTDPLNRPPVAAYPGLPKAQGLYDPAHEHDACGIGFIVDIHNRKKHQIIQNGLQMLSNLEHRGAVGADPEAGDGVGLLMQLPHEFLVKVTAKEGLKLPPPGQYGVGMFFMPKNENSQAQIKLILEKAVTDNGQKVLGWRDVPVDNSVLGYSVKPTEPDHVQLFIGRGG